MARESKSGSTAQGTKDIGRTTRLMDSVDLSMLMGMSTRESGQMIRPMDLESTHMLMGQDMKGNG
jgi:hypothetical protein